MAYKSIFNKGQTEQPTKETSVVKTLPSHLGGGSYNSVIGQPNKLVKTERDYAGVKVSNETDRHHIIPVEFGGDSTLDQNIKALGTKAHDRITKQERLISSAYKNGIISLPEARVKIIGLLQKEEMESQGVSTNVWKNVVNNLQRGGEAKTKEIYGQATEQQKASMGLYGEKAKKEADLKKVEYLKSPEGQLKKAEQNLKEAENRASFLTAPVRFTAGSMATFITSYALEKADANLKYTPKTDAEKLLIGEGEIQRLTKQEDLYGTIARGAGIPTAIIVGAILEQPFLTETGISKGIKEILEKQIAKQGEKYLAKMGQREIIKMADDLIKAEIKTGKIEKEVAEKALKDINNFRVKEVVPENKVANTVKQVEETKPTTGYKSIKVTAQDHKNFKTAEDYVKAQPTAYHFTSPETKITKWSTKKSQGRIWFTDKTDVSDNIGASGRGKMYTVRFDKDAKWATPQQADKSYTDQLIADGYDGVYHPDSSGEYGNYYEVFNPKVIKTKSQLISEWNKAQKLKQEVKVEPITYEPLIKESSIPKRIGNEVIEKGLVKDLGELPTYEKVTFKDQAKLVGDIIDNDPELAFRIAMGEAVSPNKALPESVFIAVKNQAIKNGDIDILRQLATSEKGVAREATELGQRIKMLDEQLEDDAFKNINDVIKSRNKKLEKNGVKVKELKAKEIKKIKNEVAKLKPVKDDWIDFVNSIKC